MLNFGPLAAEIVSLVWGTPANFNGFRVLAVLLRGTLVEHTLHLLWQLSNASTQTMGTYTCKLADSHCTSAYSVSKNSPTGVFSENISPAASNF